MTKCGIDLIHYGMLNKYVTTEYDFIEIPDQSHWDLGKPEFGTMPFQKGMFKNVKSKSGE